MGFLKKFGQIMVKGLAPVTGIAPIIEQQFPGSSGIVNVVSRDLAQIAAVVQQVEVMGQALSIAGPQKLIAAAPLVEQIILSSSLVANHKIADEAKFRAACGVMAGAMADILTSLEDKVETTSKT